MTTLNIRRERELRRRRMRRLVAAARLAAVLEAVTADGAAVTPRGARRRSA